MAVVVWLAAGPAAADPILDLPTVGRGGLIGPPTDASDRVLEKEPGRRRRSARAAGSTVPARLPGRTGTSELALVVEMSGLAILGAERITVFPEIGQVEGGEPELALMRVGLVGWSGCQPFGFAVRVDLGEGLRLDQDDFERAPAAATDRLIDDAYGVWVPRAWAQVWAGRQPVVFSRFRQVEHALWAGGAPPFLIDRIAPDRRWGAAFHGDLGGIAYAAGVYADHDRVELRPLVPEEDDEMPDLGPPLLPDPSAGGRTAVAAHVEWTPRAPMGPGSAPTPRSDPWYDTPRVSAGAGVLWRWREPALGNRVDLSLSGGAKYQAVSAMGELILSIDDRVALAGAAEVNFLATDRLLLFGRAEYDIEVDWWTIGPGASYFITGDRWNKVAIFGWVRRKGEDFGPDGDGVIVQLQAAL
ncbi:MAG TPA: hypothetical protein VNO33_15725 [Kofleriaceae bacterium]|nr:hypothetical protein [Kofleriaceae bacterium]